MRIGDLIVLSIVTVCISCISREKQQKTVSNVNCVSVIDSARVFVQTSEFAVNYPPTILDNDRNLRLDRWLLKLSFQDLTCLLDHNDRSLQLTGFMYAMNDYEDSLNVHYSHLLNDKTMVKLYTGSGHVMQELAFGQLLTYLVDQNKEEEKDFSRQAEFETKTRDFITRYSAFPASYKPYSFPSFFVGSDENDDTNFKIHHEYELKNKSGKVVRCTSAFVFDKSLTINTIEKDSTKVIYSYPPKLAEWLFEFGRKLTKEDSLALKLR